MSKSTKIIFGLIIIVLIVWGLSSLGQPPADTTMEADDTMVESEPIKVGFIGPLTGEAAIYGEGLKNVVQLAVDEINDAGGADGKQIEVIYQDGFCTGKDAANAMRALVVEGVEVVLGGFCSSESLSAVPIAEENKIFLLSLGSSSPDLTGISPFFARTYPSDASQGSVLANVAYDKGWRKVSNIVEQQDFSLGIFRAFEKSFTDLGGEVTKEEFAPGVADFRTSLTKMQAESPDAVFVITQTAVAANRIFKQMQELDWDLPLLINDVIITDAPTRSEYSDFLESAIGAEFDVDPSNTTFQAALSAYEERYGVEMPYQTYAQTEYDGVYLLKDAIEEVGYDAKKIAEWFRNVDGWVGASGSVTIGDDGDRVGGHTAKVIRDGVSVKYEPEGEAMEKMEDAMMEEEAN